MSEPTEKEDRPHEWVRSISLCISGLFLCFAIYILSVGPVLKISLATKSPLLGVVDMIYKPLDYLTYHVPYFRDFLFWYLSAWHITIN